MSPAEPFPLPLPPLSLAEKMELGESPALILVRLADLATALENGEFVPAARLSPAELERYRGYRFPKRRLEWLGGRWAAKNAAAMLHPETGPEDWQVESGPYGRPFYQPLRGCAAGTELSITHSHGLAAAVAVAGHPCGLDLQRVTATILRIREKFCHDSEAELLGSGKKPERLAADLTMLWSAKEALRKALGGHPLTGFLAMRLEGLEKIAERAWLLTLVTVSGGNVVEHPVATWWLEDFATALTVAIEE